MQFLCQLGLKRSACATHNCALSLSASASADHKKLHSPDCPNPLGIETRLSRV